MGVLSYTKISGKMPFRILHITFFGDIPRGMVCSVVGDPGDPMPEYLEEV